MNNRWPLCSFSVLLIKLFVETLIFIYIPSAQNFSSQITQKNQGIINKLVTKDLMTVSISSTRLTLTPFSLNTKLCNIKKFQQTVKEA